MKWKVLGQSVQQNITEGLFDRDAWFDYGSAAIGGALYPVIPTAIERVMGWDMSGWKGALTGLVVTSLIGLGTGQAGMTCGALGAFTAHMSYSVLNERVIYPIFGQYLFRWDPTASVTFADNETGQQNAIQEGAYRQTLPDGREVPVYREEDLGVASPTGATTTSAMSDYGYSLPAATTGVSDYAYSLPEVTLSDYAEAIPASKSTLSGYVQSMPTPNYGANYGRGFADEDSYADAYM